MATRDEIIRLLLKAEGGPEVADLEKRIESLGQAGEQAASELDALLSELDRNAGLQRAAEQFREVGARVLDYQRAIRAGQDDIARLSAAQRASAAAVEGQREELAAARAELARLTDVNERYIDTEQSRAAATEQARLKVDILSRALKGAEADQRQYTRELDAARIAVQRTAAAQDKLRPTLESLRGTLREAGLSTTQLGAAQQELGNRSSAAVAGIKALAKSLEDSQAASAAAAAAEAEAARVAAEAAAERAAAERAVAEAAQAAADRISNAHEKLGTKPFGDIAREIQEVRQAYRDLAASGTLSEQALAQANARMIGQIRELQAQTSGWSGALDRVKGSVIAAGAGLFGVTRILKSSAEAASDFQTRIAQISTLLENDSGIPKITDDIRALAAEFGGKASTQAQAFYDVLSAGYENAADAAVLLDTSNKLAIGGVTDLGTATNGLVAVLKAYGLEANSAQRVADAYFTAAKGGATNVKELAESVGQVAPQAAIAKIPIETLTAAIGALTNGGVKTADAVTQVASILQAVIKPSEEAKAKAAELGIEFDLAAVRAQGLQGFLQTLAGATQGNEEALAVLLGRVEGLRGVLSLTGPLAGDFAKILRDMGSAAGATQTAFEKLRDTPAASMARFQASLERVQIALGDVVTAAAPLLDFIGAAARGFATLPESVQSTILALGALAAVVAPIATIAKSLQASWLLLSAAMRGPLVSAIGVASGAIRGLFALLTNLPGSVGIKIALIGGAAAIAGAQALADAIYRASDAGKEAESRQASLRKEIEANGEKFAAAANRLREFADVQLLSAQQTALLSEREREAYATRLDGLQQYLQAQVYALQNLGRLRDLSEEEAAQLANLRDRLNAAKDGHAALATGAQIAADALKNQLTPAAQLMMRSLGDIGTTSKSTSEALQKVFDGLDLRNVTKVGDAALAIESIGEKSATAGAVVRDTLAEQLRKLSGEDLLRFQSAAQAAFDEVGRSGAQSAVVLDSTLRAGLDLLKVDAAKAGVAFTESGKQAIAAFEAIAQNARASAGQIEEAFKAALGLVQTRQEAEALGRTLRSAGDQGRIGLAAVDEAGRALQRRLREIAAAVSPLADEFAALGIKSQRELEAARDSAREAFDAIVAGARNGKAAQEDVRRAFLAYAEAARAAAADSDAWKRQELESALAVQASTIGLAKALEQAGEAGKAAGEKTGDAFASASDKIDSTTDAAGRLKSRADAAAAGVGGIGSAAASATTYLGAAANQLGTVVLLSTEQQRLLRSAWEEFERGQIAAVDYENRVREAMTGVNEELQRQEESLRRFQDAIDDVRSQIAQLEGDDNADESIRHDRRLRDLREEFETNDQWTREQYKQLVDAENRLHELKLRNIQKQQQERSASEGSSAPDGSSARTPSAAPGGGVTVTQTPALQVTQQIAWFGTSPQDIERLSELLSRPMKKKIDEINGRGR